jgi:DNA-3-methyladenine glycosylase
MDGLDVLTGQAHEVAPLLLGAHITSHLGGQTVTVRLTEVEAYGGVGEDPGSHAFRRQTPRNATMFGPAGHLYVYFTYGMHWCANVVTGMPGIAGAVLLRAGEVVEGIEQARVRRPASSDRDLARGPARLAQVLSFNGDVDGADLRGPHITLMLAPTPSAHETSPRTGVAGDGAVVPWRFFLPGDRFVSPYRRASSR